MLNRYTAQKLYRGFESLPLRSAVLVKTKVMRKLLLAAALLGAVGCGGNDGNGGAATYVLFDHPVTVPGQVLYCPQRRARSPSATGR